METIETIKKLPTDDEIIAANPLSDEGAAQVAKDRQEIKDILEQLADVGTLYLTLNGGEKFPGDCQPCQKAALCSTASH